MIRVVYTTFSNSKSAYLRAMLSIESKMKAELAARYAQALLRKIPEPIGDRVDFCSNDYLGFAQTISVSHTVCGGATGSRLISGNSNLAEELEQEIASFHKAEAALLFTSGYTANIGLLPAVAGRNDTIIYDKLLHASLRDGIQLSKAAAFGFKHNDVADLALKLAKAKGEKFVVVESVYSMDGDEAPLLEIANLCKQEGALLIVDEAHGTGVCGEKGEGLVQALGLEKLVWARIHTFGKAIGNHGAAVVGSCLLKDYLINYARSFIYTTSLPHHSLLSIRAAYRALQSGDAVKQLNARIHYFLSHCSLRIREKLLPSTSPIQAVLCPGNLEVNELAKALRTANFAVLPIRYPTVPKGRERIRICLHLFNTEEEIHQLLVCLENHLK